MAKPLHSLTDKGVKALGVGRHADGGGLYLYVNSSSRAWVMRYTIGASRKELGLGGYPKVSLSAARVQAADIRRILERGGDPKAERQALKRETRENVYRNTLAAKSSRELSNVIDRAFEAEKAGLKDDGSAGRWMSPLKTHVIPKLGKCDVETITPQDVATTLRPIWHDKPDVARKAAQRLGKILAYARAEGMAVGRDIIADARDILGKQLHVSKRIPAMSWTDVPQYYASLDEGSVDLCLRLLILTGVRSKPARFAHVDQFEGDLWVIPAMNMKGSAQQALDETNNFRVPLSSEAQIVIETAKRFSVDGFLFTGPRGRPISDMAMSAKMRRDGIRARPHGFRSALRTWANANTSASFEVKEMTLAHKVGGLTERSYVSEDMPVQRRALLDQWATFVTQKEPETATSSLL
ncbi:MAG: integrase arm-type DNA-binding domain-containing protein [Paracoccaceae bacterium]